MAPGVLVVVTTMPSVPLDDELLALLSVGIPVGLGVYWAWVRRDASASTKTAGFVAALAGSLAGAFLGFHATEGLMALVTTIIGATAGANLLLILLDTTLERPARRGAAVDAPTAGVVEPRGLNDARASRGTRVGGHGPRPARLRVARRGIRRHRDPVRPPRSGGPPRGTTRR